MGEVAMKKLSLEEFLADWEAGYIHEVQGAGNRLFGKSVKGQADNPRGYIMVYADAAEKIEKPWYKFW